MDSFGVRNVWLVMRAALVFEDLLVDIGSRPPLLRGRSSQAVVRTEPFRGGIPVE
jgi:hypothetical protein